MQEGFVLAGPYVLEAVSDDVPGVTDAECRALQSALTAMMHSGRRDETLVVAPRGWRLRRLDVSPTQVQLNRLLRLLALTDGERDFVAQGVEVPASADFWPVLADFVEERSTPEVGARFRGVPALQAAQSRVRQLRAALEAVQVAIRVDETNCDDDVGRDDLVDAIVAAALAGQPLPDDVGVNVEEDKS